MSRNVIIFILAGALVGYGVVHWLSSVNQYKLPQGEPVPIDEVEETTSEFDEAFEIPEDFDTDVPTEIIDTEDEVEQENDVIESSSNTPFMSESSRQIFVTDGQKHSIPIEEILSGGPPKDGIPSIDNPQFTTVADAAEFLEDDEIGTGIVVNGDARFYPFMILVWHELVNDTIGGEPIVVSYCPLCRTAVSYERVVNGEETTFGVSGLLWQSNLLMYNRTGNPETETLWSQVLGEGVVGPETGTKLTIVPSDIVRFSDWKKQYPNTKVLTTDTGSARSYGVDPYGDYYTDNNAVSFGATLTDTRLPSKDMVLGIEIDGQFKAYPTQDLPVGTITDTFAGKSITIEKSTINEVRMFVGEERQELPYIAGFWFSWVAVHPETELYSSN